MKTDLETGFEYRIQLNTKSFGQGQSARFSFHNAPSSGGTAAGPDMPLPSLGADDPSLPGTGISSAAFTTDAAGTYWVVAQAQGDSPSGWARFDDMVLERRVAEGCPSVAGPDVEICQGDVVQVGTGCLPDPHPLENVEYCYSWIPAEGLQGASEAMPFVFPNITTIYTVRVTNSQGELVVEDQVEVSVLPAPVVEGPETPYSICKPALPGLTEGEPAARAVSNCPNSSATLDAGTGFQSYLWSTGETGQAVTVSAEGYYYVTVTNENGCEGYGVFSVIEEYCSEVALSTDEEALCPGGQLTISAPPGYDAYLWSTGEAGASIAVAQEGVYSLEATTPDGCLAYGEVDIGVYSLEITPNRVALCEGESLVLEAGEGQMPYSWSGPQGAIDEEGSSITANSAGLYSVTVTNTAGCTLSQSVMVNDCCDPRIYFDGQEYRNGETIVFTPQNVMFGIVFLETDENSIIPYFEWAINGKVYRGRQIALRVIDFFPPLTATPYIILAMPASPCSEIRLSVDVSQIDVADYLPPAKMTLHLVDYFGGNPAILNHLPNVIQEAEAIYSGNDIDWINYEMATSNLGISNLPVITDIGVELYKGNDDLQNQTQHTSDFYWKSKLNATELITRGADRYAYIMAHEALHVLLNRLGMLLYGSPRYFQHKNTPGGPHIHQLHQEVNVFGINLNTDGDEFSEQSDYDDAKRIYPVQRYYVQKFWDYFYLKDTDLMAALSPDNGQYITPIISRWQTIRNRFKVILKDGSGIRYSLFSGDDNDNVKLEQQNFYSNNPFIFE